MKKILLMARRGAETGSDSVYGGGGRGGKGF